MQNTTESNDYIQCIKVIRMLKENLLLMKSKKSKFAFNENHKNKVTMQKS